MLDSQSTDTLKKSNSRKSDKPYKGRADLDVILGSSETEHDSCNIALSKIVLSSQQPRRYFDAEKLMELSESIKKYGVLENLLVRPIGQNKYELVAGERRYRAAIEAGLTKVPVTIKQLSDESALQIALIENLQREDLNPIEETEGLLLLIAQNLKISTQDVTSLLYKLNNDNKKNTNHNVMVNSQQESIEQIFREIGGMSWQSFVANRLPLLNLPEEILESLKKGQIAYTKAIAISKIKNKDQRISLLNKAIESNLSIREIKEAIKQLQIKDKSDSPKQQIAQLVKDINKSKLWESDPKKWNKVQGLLNKIENILHN